MALPAVERLDLSEPTQDTMRVRWRAAPAASGYMILYAPLTQGEPDDEKEVRGTRRRENGRSWSSPDHVVRSHDSR